MAASSSSSSSLIPWKYDVFLNFRGEDTGKSFIGHLYKALDQKAIDTFMDSEELRKGNDLSRLLTAIHESRLSIVVFSENYVSSTWCLKELVQIMDSMDNMKQIVVPVFYQVEPSDIRKLKRSFGEAFAQHEGDSNADMKELQSWRSALKRATDMSGWYSRYYEDDAKLIEDIVDDVFNKLIDISSSEDNGLIGMDSHFREMDLLLHPGGHGTDDVRVVGIWGMGGLGKTTIARAVYNRIACEFEACCFLENVKEGFSKNGAVHMLGILLSRLLKEKVWIGTLDRGSKMIRERLGNTEVLLVIDDVDNLEQIEALIGMQHSFGGGSRIIITTRDMQLLSGADSTYRPQALSDCEALQLFRQYAFKKRQPIREFDFLSWRAVKYAQGLPLALKVLGAFLHSINIRVWEDMLDKLEKAPQHWIHNVLRTSFDGLDDSEKAIFLDIACFFKGMDKDHATKILDVCGLFPHVGLKVLADRALITVSLSNELGMHDLIEGMGREIVHQESIEEPGRRSRLWNKDDVQHVLTRNTGTEAVESIILTFSSSKVGDFNTEALGKMAKLRLLRIDYSIDCDDNDLSCDEFEFLSPAPEVRCLLWDGCPLKSFPSNFYPQNVVYLSLKGSRIEQLFKEIKPLQKLKIINLSSCHYLRKSPDFTWAPNLEEIILDNCSYLAEVHPSMSTLKSLKTLNLSGYSSLDKFPEISEVMEKLSKLYLYETQIKELPSSISNLTGLIVLKLRNCKELRSLPSIIGMKSLKFLDLSGCSSLDKFPEISELMEELLELYLNGTRIKELPSSINNLTGLIVLKLRNCKELRSLPSIIGMKSLKFLDLSGCSSLDKFPEISEVMEELSELYLDETRIKELPSSINNLTCLIVLNLTSCKELESLPSITGMKSLKFLDLSGCSSLDKFPEISEVMEELLELYLNGTRIKELPLSINNLTGLIVLKLRNCKELRSLPSTVMKSLEVLDLIGCSSLGISEVMYDAAAREFGGPKANTHESSASCSIEAAAVNAAAGQSSPKESSPCSSEVDEMYDVFLSFRSEDTRKTFTDHLYWTLKDTRLDVYIGEDNKDEASSLPDDVKRAIEQSTVAVVIFSRRYAESRRCLEELDKMIKCRTTLGLVVLPIFYQVEPSEVQSWGWWGTKTFFTQADLVFRKNEGYEGLFIRKVVDEITRNLKTVNLKEQYSPSFDELEGKICKNNFFPLKPEAIEGTGADE